jgi:hypothetical protein
MTVYSPRFSASESGHALGGRRASDRGGDVLPDHPARENALFDQAARKNLPSAERVARTVAVRVVSTLEALTTLTPPAGWSWRAETGSATLEEHTRYFRTID